MSFLRLCSLAEGFWRKASLASAGLMLH